MEQVVKKLNWIYYSQMVIALIVLTVMYYMLSKGMYEPLDYLSRKGVIVQYFIIADALITIPLGLYLVKLFVGLKYISSKFVKHFLKSL